MTDKPVTQPADQPVRVRSGEGQQRPHAEPRRSPTSYAGMVANPRRTRLR